jgi:hypothetical protein
MPSNTTYNPPNIDAFIKTALNYDAVGVTGTAAAGNTTNIDYALTNDTLITGAQVLTNTAAFGDSISFQVVDVNNILGYGANVVLNQFVTNWQLRADSQEQIDLKVNYPAKIITGLYLRLIYVSTGTSPVAVAINYSLHKVLL